MSYAIFHDMESYFGVSDVMVKHNKLEDVVGMNNLEHCPVLDLSAESLQFFLDSMSPFGSVVDQLFVSGHLCMGNGRRNPQEATFIRGERVSTGM